MAARQKVYTWNHPVDGFHGQSVCVCMHALCHPGVFVIGLARNGSAFRCAGFIYACVCPCWPSCHSVIYLAHLFVDVSDHFLIVVVATVLLWPAGIAT